MAQKLLLIPIIKEKKINEEIVFQFTKQKQRFQRVSPIEIIFLFHAEKIVNAALAGAV